MNDLMEENCEANPAV